MSKQQLEGTTFIELLEVSVGEEFVSLHVPENDYDCHAMAVCM